MNKLGFRINQTVDCNKGRYTFSVLIGNIDGLNELIVKLLNEGFNPIPSVQKI